ncbi:hypothetical protein EBT31_15270, partial [bacterium]|nr:hypothetical protein [bacterium]
MTAAPQLEDASAMAGTAGLKALGYGYQPTAFTTQSFTDRFGGPGFGSFNQPMTVDKGDEQARLQEMIKGSAQPGPLVGTSTMPAPEYDPSKLPMPVGVKKPQSMAEQYMNPYMDAINQSLQRQADIQRQTLGAQAAKAGAFGGARDVIGRSQLNAELMRQQQQAQAQAFQSAQQQFNQEQAQRMQAQQLAEQSRQYGAGIGLQGLQTALQGAQQLGALGQTQYGQEMGINQLQSQLGAQQQQQMQNILGAQYQDFLNFQNYPYKQLGFFSDILRGVPLTQTGSALYQAPPTALQTVTGLGLGAAGISNLLGRKEGGSVQSYAEGGSVMSPEFKRYAVDNVDPRSLPLVQRNAMARGDIETMQAAIDEMSEDAALRRGIAAVLPYGADVVRAAGGGIIAFQGGGDTGYDRTFAEIERAEGEADDYDYENASDAQMEGEGVPDLQRRALMETLRYGRRIGQYQPTRMTPEEERAYVQRQYELEKELAGPNEAGAMLRKYLADSEAGRAGALQQGRGIALLRAAQAAVQPGGTIRGLAGAGAAFGESYNKALEADRAEQRALKMAQFQLLDAERKERLGFTKSAMSSLAARQRHLQDADKFNIMKLNYQAQASGKAAQAARPLKPATPPKPSAQAEGVRDYYNYFKEAYPEKTEAQLKKMANDAYLEKKGAGLPGVTARVEATADEKAR